VVRGTNSQIRIIETDSANKQWKMEVQNSKFSITENNVAIPITIEPDAGNNAIFIKNGGNVGVGTNNPATKLQVNGSATVNGKLLLSDSLLANNGIKVNTNIQIRGANSQVRIIETDSANKEWKMEVQNNRFSVTEAGVAVPLTVEPSAGNNALFIKNGGNVGIGTNNPVTKLQVNGSATVNGKLLLSDSLLANNGIKVNADVQITSNNFLELGQGVTKEAEAGRLYYQRYSSGLDIIGAGTTTPLRKIKLWAEGGTEIVGSIDVNGKTNTDSLQTSGNATIGGNATITGDTKTNTLQVGGNTGTVISKMQAGTFNVGAGTVGSLTRIVVFTFPNAFTAPPKIIATPRNDASNFDEFRITTTTVTATSVTFIITRADITSVPPATAGWSQSLKIDWWAIE
jgi:hypothetical protein